VGIKTVHILFISTCMLMSLALGVWRYQAFADGAGAAALLQALACVVAAGGLGVYGVAFLRKLRGLGYMALPLAFFLIAAAPEAATACSTCFGDPQSPLTEGMNQAIAFLLGVIGTVLFGFASLFLYWAYRHRLNEAASDGMVH
jgi:hypothetical protein